MLLKEQALENRKHELEAELGELKVSQVQLPDEINSKKFLLNIVSMRILRQKNHTVERVKEAERKIMNDTRLLKYASIS